MKNSYCYEAVRRQVMIYLKLLKANESLTCKTEQAYYQKLRAQLIKLLTLLKSFSETQARLGAEVKAPERQFHYQDLNPQELQQLNN